MKYKLTEVTKEFCGRKLHRIVCVTAFASVAVGDVGGWVESERNLSQNGDACVYDDAEVSYLTDLMVLKNSWSSGRYFTYTA